MGLGMVGQLHASDWVDGVKGPSCEWVGGVNGWEACERDITHVSEACDRPGRGRLAASVGIGLWPLQYLGLQPPLLLLSLLKLAVGS